MMSLTFDKEYPVAISSGNTYLDGILHVPKEARGIVLFAHGSGSGRFSRRNQHVATFLNEAKLATLLFDLLTPEEEKVDMITSGFRFDIEFLTSRLISATEWCLKQEITRKLIIGYFGASTGGGAALVAAAKESRSVKAIVSRGGRPDLAGKYLEHVEAPTLLIVGGDDKAVIEMNRTALLKMHCIKNLEIIPGATHLFEEPGKLDEVARLAKDWFIKYLN